jgi:hypothetical protein
MTDVRATRPPLHLCRVAGADFVSGRPRLVFERADREVGARLTVTEIVLNERLKPTASFTLRNVHELVQKQLAIAPAVGANDNPMADGYTAGSVSDDMGTACRLSQLFIVRQWNLIDNQDFHTGAILNTDSARIGGLPWY